MKIGVSLFQYFAGKVGGAGEALAQALPRVLFHMGSEDRLYLFGTEETLETLWPLCDDSRVTAMTFPMSRRAMHLRRVCDLVCPGLLTRAILKQINSLGLDIIWYPQQSMFPFGIKAKSAVTVVDFQHDHLPENFSRLERWVRRRKDHQFATHADRTFNISKMTRDDLFRQHCADPARAKVLYLGGGRSELRPDAAPEGRTERPYLFYPANAYPHKNHVRLVRAFREFKEKHPEETAQLVMTGQRQPHLDEELSRCRPEHGIFHLGFVSSEELDRLYRDCRAVFFPSLFEGFGIPIIEGMSYGKPIFCHRLPVFEELVGEKVRYFDAGSEASIVPVLEKIFDREADLSVDLGAYTKVLKGLNWDSYGEHLWHEFQELAAESATAGSLQQDSLRRAA